MLIEIINQWSRKYPERIAHRHRDRYITYADLIRYSDALAVLLYEEMQKKSIKRGTPIIVHGHKESEMLVAFLASVKAGCPYIPIDSSLPAERIKQILDASQSRIFISSQNIPREVTNGSLFTLEHFSLEGTALSPFLDKEPSPDWRATTNEVYYIIFTSGSTGVPKGVQITLGALESFLDWVNQAYGPIEGQEIFLNQAPFSFDLSVMDLYMSLSTGGTLLSIDKEMIANPGHLFSEFRDSGISYWVSTPSFAEMCLIDKSFNAELLPQLKRFLFCGEVLTHDCATKLVKRFPQSLVENLYGPTEATVATTTLTITEDILKRYNPLPIGRPKPDSQILICNPHELDGLIEAAHGILPSPPETVSEGTKGEIVIAGPNVSVGYLNNPTLTKKSFFQWYDRETLWRAYRTGDSGQWQGEFLYYHGRLDFQVKLHGYRIELGDIEENLRQIEWIDNAVVIPVEKNGKVDHLHAFMTTKEPVSDEFSASQKVRQSLKSLLPDYMIPRKMSFLEQMPMTINGKVNRKALLGGEK